LNYNAFLGVRFLIYTNMAYDELLAERIANKLLQHEVLFIEKKMFGGIAFMIDDKMCIGVMKDEIMLRILDEKYEFLIEQPHTKPMQFTGKTMKGFLFIEESGFQTDKDLQQWIDLAIEFGRFGIVKSKKKKK
jgi:TfoX/Sxy family transcriptional regulator of competence genes